MNQVDMEGTLHAAFLLMRAQKQDYHCESNSR